MFWPRLKNKEVPDVYNFVLQQIEGIHDENAAKKLIADYSDVFYDDLMKVINDQEDDDVIERFKEEYHEEVYIAIKNMLAVKSKPVMAEQSVRASFKKGDFIGQDYEVYDVLGEGGFGIVYLVYSQRTKEIYALKTFRDEYLADKKTRDCFQKEALVWINLERHPYIVEAFLVVEISGRLYIGMEHIASDESGMNTLDGYLKRRPPDLVQSLKWAIQFCHGMEHAYSKGIKAHRDIKTSNIMIDQNMAVKIDHGFWIGWYFA